MSYTREVSRNVITPLTLTPTVTEFYRFVYDGNDRVSEIFYTSNDSNKLKVNTGNLDIRFSYIADTIYKTSTDLRTRTVVERDTFLMNSLGQITDAYFPNEVHNFRYYGKLLATETVAYRDTNTVISANLSYTSNNGDFLSRFFDGNLTASFPDTGLRVPSHILPGDTVRDTVLIYPIEVTWTTVTPFGAAAAVQQDKITGHTDNFNVSSLLGSFVMVDAVDSNGVKVRTGYFPAGYTGQQFYQIYDFLDNRPGDYLQLQSFTTYGVNIYPQAHMLKSITSSFSTLNVNYDIDADSKVTRTTAFTRDSVTKNTMSEIYSLQYETKN